MGSLSVPHLQGLDRPLKPESAITIKGTVTGAKFDINLANGPNVSYAAGSDDIALHLSFRTKQKALVANSFAGGNWNGEEKFDGSGIQKEFEITFGAADDHFKIFVNNNYVGDIKYRSPVEKITHVQVLGDVSLNSVTQIGGEEAKPEAQPEPEPEPEPEPKPEPQPEPEPDKKPEPKPEPVPEPEPKPEPVPEPVPQPEPQPEPKPEPKPEPTPAPHTFPTPYVLPIPSHFAPGHKLRISAIPESNAAHFHINLYAGFLNAFHYEPRFSEKTVNRDSRKEGEDWDKQVESDNKLQGFPYSPEKQFELVYQCDNDAFQVFVDGAQHFAFKHRLSPNEIDAVGIEGDIKLTKVAFE